MNVWRLHLHTAHVIGAVLGAGVVLAFVGLLGITTPPSKLPIPGDVYVRLGDPWARAGLPAVNLNPNELAGALICFIPLAVIVSFRRGGTWARALAVTSTPLLLAALILTQSRGAMLALASSLLVGALFWGGMRVALWTIGGLALVASAAYAASVAEWQAPLVLTGPTASLAGRVELWRRGLAMLLDAPATGIGLNAFPGVLQQYYPTTRALAPSVVQHADNLYLQTALDLGLPGLVALLALACRAVRHGRAAIVDNELRPLAIGLLLGLLAYSLHGLVEAVGVSARAGLILWVMLGLLGSVGLASGSSTGETRSPSAAEETHWRVLRIGFVLPAALLLTTPLALNGAVVLLHRPAAAATFNSLIASDLNLADRLAWGPFRARVWAAQSLAAGNRGDATGELALLDLATHAAPWDPSLAIRLADLDLQAGDTAGAVGAWQLGHLVEIPLSRGQASPPKDALAWFALAHRVDPADWRPFAGAAAKLAEAGRDDYAATMLDEALRLGGAKGYEAAIEMGLRIESIPQGAALEVQFQNDDVDPFAEASAALAGS